MKDLKKLKEIIVDPTLIKVWTWLKRIFLSNVINRFKHPLHVKDFYKSFHINSRIDYSRFSKKELKQNARRAISRLKFAEYENSDNGQSKAENRLSKME